MNLAEYSKLPPADSGNGNYLRFRANDNTKIVRFCYADASEIVCRKKKYENGKTVWDTEDGKWSMQLRVAVYSDKQNYEIMTWDRSSHFGTHTLLPLFENAGGRICDQVYRVVCTNAGTMDATFNFFAVPDPQNYAMPDLSAQPAPAVATPTAQPTVAPAPFTQQVAPTPVAPAPTAPVAQPAPAPVAQPTKKKNFWEE